MHARQATIILYICLILYLFIGKCIASVKGGHHQGMLSSVRAIVRSKQRQLSIDQGFRFVIDYYICYPCIMHTILVPKDRPSQTF